MKTVIDLVNLIKDKFSMRKDIAPVETSSTASRAYKAGEEFYYGNLLQRATQDITQGSGLAGGVNFENADPVAVQVVSVKETLTNNVKCSGVVNYYQRTVESGRVGSSSSTVSRTVNADESITYSAGTVKANDNIAVNELISRPMYLADGTYDVSFGLNSAVSGFVYALLGWTGSAWTTLLSYDELSNKRQFIASNTYEYYSLQIKATHNTVVSTAFTIYPLVNEPWYSGNYVAPSLTNRQLTTDKVGMDLLSEVGAVNYCINNATSQVDAQSGLSYTVNSDKSITVFATNNTYPFTVTHDLYIFLSGAASSPVLPKGIYTRSGCPSGGSSSTYMFAGSGYADTGNGVTFTLAQDTAVDNVIKITNNSVLSAPLTFYPMISPVDYTGDYVPYAKSNKKLTEDVSTVDIKSTLTSSYGTFSVTYAYKVGKIVYASGTLTLTSAATAWSKIMAMEISGEKFSDQFAFVAGWDYNNKVVVPLQVGKDSGGKLKIENMGNIANGVVLKFTFTAVLA